MKQDILSDKDDDSGLASIGIVRVQRPYKELHLPRKNFRDKKRSHSVTSDSFTSSNSLGDDDDSQSSSF